MKNWNYTKNDHIKGYNSDKLKLIMNKHKNLQTFEGWALGREQKAKVKMAEQKMQITGKSKLSISL